MTDIVVAARDRGITRLCHLTRSVNLMHILATREIQAKDQLDQSAEGYRPADDQRLDDHHGHVSCSLEYPNGWYLGSARTRDPNFNDWVVLTLDLELLDEPGVKLSPFNAARGRGSGISEGLEGFTSLFAPEVSGKKPLSRGELHPSWWPTDDQAEALVPAPIPLDRVRNILVKDEEQAKLELFRLRQGLGNSSIAPPMALAPILFNEKELSKWVRAGRRPPELPFSGGTA